MHFFRLNILEPLFCCNICFIQSDYSIFFIKSLVENNSQNWNFAFLLKPTLSQVMAIWNRNKHSSIINRVLLRFEFHVPHQILYTILATDEKLPLTDRLGGKEALRPTHFSLYQTFFCIFQNNSAMATLGLKEMGNFLWEGWEKSLPSWR